MLTVFFVTLLGTFLLNVADLLLTNRLFDKLGPDAEANPLARFLYERWGKRGVVWFKGAVVLFYVGAMGYVGYFGDAGSFLHVANVVVMGVYAFTVGRGHTLWVFLR